MRNIKEVIGLASVIIQTLYLDYRLDKTLNINTERLDRLTYKVDNLSNRIDSIDERLKKNTHNINEKKN